MVVISALKHGRDIHPIWQSYPSYMTTLMFEHNNSPAKTEQISTENGSYPPSMTELFAEHDRVIRQTWQSYLQNMTELLAHLWSIKRRQFSRCFVCGKCLWELLLFLFSFLYYFVLVFLNQLSFKPSFPIDKFPVKKKWRAVYIYMYTHYSLHNLHAKFVL